MYSSRFAELVSGAYLLNLVSTVEVLHEYFSISPPILVRKMCTSKYDQQVLVLLNFIDKSTWRVQKYDKEQTNGVKTPLLPEHGIQLVQLMHKHVHLNR